MNLLVDFLLRTGFGMALGLVLTPAAAVPAGFFRVNLLVIMGGATFAALALAGAGAEWLLPAAAAVIAWVGGILWLAGRSRGGIVSCLACMKLLATATLLRGGWTEGPVALVSGALVGLTLHAMLLGHWYLNAPGMRVDVLRRMIDVALVAWGIEACVALPGLLGMLAAVSSSQPPDRATLALEALRGIGGIVGLPVLLVMSRQTLAIPNTQSATGILYVACLAAITGDLAARLLALPTAVG
jgi:hypothetical protein